VKRGRVACTDDDELKRIQKGRKEVSLVKNERGEVRTRTNLVGQNG